MGFGDEILATGLARGARDRGKRIAFGDGKQIIFSPWSPSIFRNNPNVAWPGDEGAADIEWVAHHKGNRLYNSLSPDRKRWVWNMSFRPVPGEMFFDEGECAFADHVGGEFILIEPNVPRHKSVAENKDWGLQRYQAVADRMRVEGRRVVQLDHGRDTLSGANVIRAQEFRQALAALSRAALYIGPEGGLHHGAAAVGVPAVVLFGGFIPSQVTGYDTHTNLTGGAKACGSLSPCQHCRAAMNAITVDDVCEAAQAHLVKRVAA